MKLKWHSLHQTRPHVWVPTTVSERVGVEFGQRPWGCVSMMVIRLSLMICIDRAIKQGNTARRQQRSGEMMMEEREGNTENGVC